jgi:hypothetical protein
MLNVNQVRAIVIKDAFESTYDRGVPKGRQQPAGRVQPAGPGSPDIDATFLAVFLANIFPSPTVKHAHPVSVPTQPVRQPPGIELGTPHRFREILMDQV